MKPQRSTAPSLTRQLVGAAVEPTKAPAGDAPQISPQERIAALEAELAQTKQILLLTQQSLLKVKGQREQAMDQLADTQAALDRANANNRQLRSVPKAPAAGETAAATETKKD